MTEIAAPTRHRVIDSPVGPLSLVGTGDALTAVYFDEHRHGPDRSGYGALDEQAFPAVVRQLDQYFAGRRTTFDLPLAPAGNPFQQRVWRLLREIPYGRTRSYGELAVLLGDPGLARAVGAANARNPLSIVVPCHRVVGADGALTGYAGGLPRKAFLLALESQAPRADALF